MWEVLWNILFGEVDYSEWVAVGWIVFAALALIIEGFTMAIFSAFFAIGAFAAAIAAYFGAPVWLQLVVFAAASVIPLVIARPLVTKFVHNSTSGVQSNVHTMVNAKGIVTIPIDNDAASGQIRVGSEFWTARNAEDDGIIIDKGTKVKILRVTGVTAWVEPLGTPVSANTGEDAPDER